MAGAGGLASGRGRRPRGLPRPGLFVLALVGFVICLAALGFGLTRTAVAATDIDPLTGAPTVNHQPSSAAAFCGDRLTPACVSAVLADIAAARADEGLGPMTLPPSFGVLGTAAQLLALTNLERVDRGLGPISGLSAGLDLAAQQGADMRADPLGPDAYPWGSNWSSGASSLFNDFGWMYDDGPGSPNLDCPGAGAAGCWGHRANILGHWGDPIGMGAAGAGGSQTQLFVSGYAPGLPGGGDAVVDPLWSAIVATIPVGVAPSAVLLAHSAARGAVAVWASGLPMDVHAAVGGGWSVAPGECNLAPGARCLISVAAPPGPAPASAMLTLVGPNGPVAVTLQRTVAVGLSARLARAGVRRGRQAVITGAAVPGVGRTAIRLEVLRAGVWHVVLRAALDARGRFALRFRPSSPGLRRYRVHELARGGYEDAASGSLTLRVTSR